MLLAAVASGIALYRSSDVPATAGLTIGWGGSEGHPCCVYDPDDHTVDAELTIEGTAPRDGTVTVTVTAYAVARRQAGDWPWDRVDGCGL